MLRPSHPQLHQNRPLPRHLPHPKRHLPPPLTPHKPPNRPKIGHRVQQIPPTAQVDYSDGCGGFE